MPGLTADSLLREFSASPVPQGDSLPTRYGGPFKDCKEELIRQFEREYLTRLLARNQRNIAKSAREAQLDRKYLYALLEKHGLAGTE
jgi:DNA-binding NtrC family response regulator